MKETCLVRTHEDMKKVYDKVREDYIKKHGLELSYSQITKIVSSKIALAGGIKV